MSDHKDYAWPFKANYLLLPTLLALRPKFLPIIDPAKQGEVVGMGVECPVYFGDFLVNIFVPVGIQLLWLSNKIYDVSLDALADNKFDRELRFDFATIWPQMRKLNIELGGWQIKNQLDLYDVDENGLIDKTGARNFVDEVFKTPGGDSVSDELFEIIYQTMGPNNQGKLYKSIVGSYCVNFKTIGESYMFSRLANLAETTPENERAIAEARNEMNGQR